MTKTLFNSLFSGKRKWICKDLQEEYLKRKHLDMKNIDDQNQLLNEISLYEQYNTYGGFGEDRTLLWEGFEDEDDKMYHLGIDFNNLDIHTTIKSVTNGNVVHILHDYSTFNGWGIRVIIKDEFDVYHLYGHLGQICVYLNQNIKQGDNIGKLGEDKQRGYSQTNGGWFCHLHYQVMSEDYVKLFENMDDIDGYHFTKNVDELNGVYNPFIYFKTYNDKVNLQL
jgi:murein DD-endopeptidase MepM/ murein hydrolase activator NlpD